MVLTLIPHRRSRQICVKYIHTFSIKDAVAPNLHHTHIKDVTTPDLHYTHISVADVPNYRQTHIGAVTTPHSYTHIKAMFTLSFYHTHINTILTAIDSSIQVNPTMDALSSFLLHLRSLEKYPIHAIMMRSEMVMRYLVIASNMFIESAFLYSGEILNYRFWRLAEIMSSSIKPLMYSDIVTPLESAFFSIHSRISSFSRNFNVCSFLSRVGLPILILPFSVFRQPFSLS